MHLFWRQDSLKISYAQRIIVAYRSLSTCKFKISQSFQFHECCKYSFFWIFEAHTEETSLVVHQSFVVQEPVQEDSIAEDSISEIPGDDHSVF